jgi:hypothetical protein
MKKLFTLTIIVLSISLGFTACDEHGNVLQSKGGHLNLINDTDSPEYFSVYFNGNYVSVNNDQTIIQPSQTIPVYSDTNTSYAVYNASGTSSSYLMTSGQLSGGNTVEIKFSDYLD